MKQANNNEVDLLLRSFASSRNARVAPSGATPGEDNRAANHLDADELNSYAEGVVPAPARARYTEHIADCDQCRRMVIGLSQASGATALYDGPEQAQRGTSFYQRLATLLSPAVLRYAVPALAFALLIGISLVVFRQRSEPAYIAQNQPPVSTQTASDPLKPAEPAAGSSATTRPEIPKPLQADSNAPVEREKHNIQDETNPSQKPGSDSEFGAPRSLKDFKSTGKESGDAQSQPSYAPEPKAAAPPPPSTATLSAADKSAETAKEQPAKREDRDEQARDQSLFKITPSDEHGPNRAASRTAGAVNTLRVGEPSRGRGGSEPNKKDKNSEAETMTTVAGRHFKREGNAWIDTAYESSRGTINVTRGSEQFRALVADEPGLRNIANQLRGVVIVVWNNRAYRIQ